MIELMKNRRGSLYRGMALAMAWLMVVSCGIEVGNPHGDDTGSKPTQSVVPISIAIADSPIDDIAHLYLNIKSISLIIDDADNLLPLTLTSAASSPVDVLSLQDGLTAVLVQQQNVASGTYHGFAIELKHDQIGYVIDTSGAQKTLQLSSGTSSYYLIVKQAFTVSNADQMVLHVDLLQSVSHTASGTYLLSAVINPISKKQASTLQGVIAPSHTGFICAYLERDGVDSEPPPDVTPPSKYFGMGNSGDRTAYLQDNDGHMPPPPSDYSNQARVPGVGQRPAQGSGGSDMFNQCFTSAPVKNDGSFGFHFLRPGQYTLRFYGTDGAPHDIAGTFNVDPQTTTNIGTVKPTGL